jgi:hypothetical protein
MAKAKVTKAKAKTNPYDRVRALCLTHSGVYEKAGWGAPTFRIDRGKMFLMFANNHHGDGRTAIWCMATADGREVLLSMDPERFFIPPYVGPSGWVGVRLEGRVPWSILTEVIAEGARLAAPKKSPRARP